MDHMDHDMHMTSTASGPMASGTGMAMDHDMGDGGMDHSGHGMDMGANGNACKISMLWNWETVDACFIDSSWQISSKGMFAGCCIGVICLVITLEFLRRVGREYDAYILRRHSIRQQIQANPTSRDNNNNESSSSSSSPAPKPATATTTTPLPDSTAANNNSLLSILTGGNTGIDGRVRPSLFDQLVRALLHMTQFAVAYFIMLLAMYYNGYFIICIFIGAFIGSFIFAWEPLGAGKEIDACAVTKCCG